MQEFEEEKLQRGKAKLKAAFIQYSIEEAQKAEKYFAEQTIEDKDFSTKLKRGINRIFREQIGEQKIPYPEVDNILERIRSFFVRSFILASKGIKKIFKRK